MLRDSIGRAAALLAMTAFAGACLLGGRAVLPDGWHADWPLALAGARGVPGAAWFNAAAFVLPGVLVALVAMRLRSSLAPHAAWTARIGARLALLSALAFAAQGLWPLDPESLDAGASRYHATAWLGWACAFVPGAGLLAIGADARRWRAACVLAAAAVVLAAFVVGTPVAQRVAFAAWLFWGIAAGLHADRAARVR